MNFQSERGSLFFLADSITKVGHSLFDSLKYLYAITKEDFYNYNFKDFIKIISENVLDTDMLKNYGIEINDHTCKEMNCKEYDDILHLILYSLAIRVYTLKGYKCDDQSLDDLQLKTIYEKVIANGAVNINNIFEDNYDSIRKKYRKKRELPEFNSNWYKDYLKKYVPELADNNFRNMVLLSASDVLFKLYYEKLEDELENQLKSFIKY